VSEFDVPRPAGRQQCVGRLVQSFLLMAVHRGSVPSWNCRPFCSNSSEKTWIDRSKYGKVGGYLKNAPVGTGEDPLRRTTTQWRAIAREYLDLSIQQWIVPVSSQAIAEGRRFEIVDRSAPVSLCSLPACRPVDDDGGSRETEWRAVCFVSWRIEIVGSDGFQQMNRKGRPTGFFPDALLLS
jgi:hypothetical protein